MNYSTILEWGTRWCLFAGSVLLTHEYCHEYWIAGTVFGLVVLFWQKKMLRVMPLRSFLFFINSTLIYALVVWISKLNYQDTESYVGILYEPLSVGVVAGSLLMSFLLKLTFSPVGFSPLKTAMQLILAWYAVYSLAFLDYRMGVPGDVDYLLMAIFLWQWLYIRTPATPSPSN